MATSTVPTSSSSQAPATDFRMLLNNGMNMTASVGSYVLNPMLKSAAIVGTLFGAICGVGAHLGLLQGVIWALYRECIQIPIGEYLSANEGLGEGKIHPKTGEFIRTAVEIGSFVLPILVTAYSGHAFGAFLGRYVVAQCLVQTDAVYTLFSGLLIWGGLYGTLIYGKTTSSEKCLPEVIPSSEKR